MGDWIAGPAGWAAGWGTLAAAALAGVVLYALCYGVAGAVARRRPGVLVLEGALLRHSRAPMRLVMPLTAVRAALPDAVEHLPPGAEGPLRTAVAFALVLSVTWLGMRLTRVLEDVAGRRFTMDAEDNLRARRVHTRVALLRRVLTVGVAMVGLGVLLLLIPGFRTLGTGLLASAGVLGVVVGVAAQRPIGNLLAGLQIAITQPIRVEDAVIVEDEWGWVEEITLTYVVVRLWDLRRLVLPIGYFLEKPFQNWTRTTASLLATAFVYADYSVPVDELRAELSRIVADSPLWDGRVCVLQVSDLTERSVQLRALVSAANAGSAWDLRCEVREKLVAFLQAHHPSALPRIRVEAEPARPLAARGAGAADSW